MVKKHLKRLFAPKDWMLSKLTGVFAPRPRCGPHKLRECLPLQIILRNRLKYALNGRESKMILRQRLVKVDNRPRTDPKYPTGFMDVVEIAKSGDLFRLLYDVKGRFELVKIPETEKDVKLCKVMKVYTTVGRTPMISTHDGRRIRFPDPMISKGDTVVISLKDGKIVNVIKARKGKVAMITGGSNRGLVGQIKDIERHPGSFDIAHLVNQAGEVFATRNRNVFVLGSTYDDLPVTLPKAKGQKLKVTEERRVKLEAAERRKTERPRARKAVRK